MKNQDKVERVFLCVEYHPDKEIVASYLLKENAEAFCNDKHNFTTSGNPKYYVSPFCMNDYMPSCHLD